MHVTELPHLGFLAEEGVHLHKRPNGELVGVFQCAPTEGKCSSHQVFDGLGIRVGLKVYHKTSNKYPKNHAPKCMIITNSGSVIH